MFFVQLVLLDIQHLQERIIVSLRKLRGQRAHVDVSFIIHSNPVELDINTFSLSKM